MKPLEQAETDRRLANVLSVGTVVAIDPGKSSARVKIGDLKTPLIQVNALRAGGMQFWWMPTVGEQVVVAAPSGDIAQAFILCSLFAKNAPSSDPNVPKINLAGGKMIIDGDLEITGNLLVKQNIQVILEMSANGNIITEADAIASGVSLKNHIHPESIGSETGVPNND